MMYKSRTANEWFRVGHGAMTRGRIMEGRQVRRQRRMNLIEAVGASVFQRWTRIIEDLLLSVPSRLQNV